MLTREDQVALLEGHDTRDVLDQFRDPVQHQRGVVVLPYLAVDLSKRKSHISTSASAREERDRSAPCTRDVGHAGLGPCPWG